MTPVQEIFKFNVIYVFLLLSSMKEEEVVTGSCVSKLLQARLMLSAQLVS